MASRQEIPLECLRQTEIDWLVRSGVIVPAMVNPVAIRATTGSSSHDGIFESCREGDRWLAFEQDDDTVFWQPRQCTLARDCGRAFALGEDVIDRAATYAFDCRLNIFADPLEWLRASRDGIVVLDWSRAFDRLRDCLRIAIAEALLPRYRLHMQPCRMPDLYVTPSRRRAVA